MAPRVFGRGFDPLFTGKEFAAQWSAPNDVFSVLLLLGGDVIQVTLAQISGWGISPVAFSFGWVAYALNAVVSAVGECKLLPQTDCPCTVINAKSGHSRANTSWVIGRIVRDYEHWCDPQVKQKVQEVIDQKWGELKAQAKRNKGTPPTTPTNLTPTNLAPIPRPAQAGLVVSFYRTERVRRRRVYDKVYLSGLLVIPIQLGIAAVPLALYGDWSIFFVVACGTLLAITTGALPQWEREKWACRQPSSAKTMILTRGQGSQHAIIIQDEGIGYDLEDLAGAKIDASSLAGLATKSILTSLAICWVLLLIAAAGIKSNTWYLLGVGALGVVQNIYVAGAPRRPESFKIALRFEHVIGCPKVYQTLWDVNKYCRGAGKHLIKEFFPIGLRPDEERQWAEEFENEGKAGG